MTIPRNDQIKAAIVAKLKANATILALLVDANGVSHPDEIRENQWQGTEFTYPNIRVRAIENKTNKGNCNLVFIKVGIAAFSEQDSSQEADKIAGIIGNELHTQSFLSEGIKFSSLMIEELIPAIRFDERTWISEVIMSGSATIG